MTEEGWERKRDYGLFLLLLLVFPFFLPNSLLPFLSQVWQSIRSFFKSFRRFCCVCCVSSFWWWFHIRFSFTTLIGCLVSSPALLTEKEWIVLALPLSFDTQPPGTNTPYPRLPCPPSIPYTLSYSISHPLSFSLALLSPSNFLYLSSPLVVEELKSATLTWSDSKTQQWCSPR